MYEAMHANYVFLGVLYELVALAITNLFKIHSFVITDEKGNKCA